MQKQRLRSSWSFSALESIFFQEKFPLLRFDIPMYKSIFKNESQVTKSWK
jgi:hypothetical protein